MRSTYLKFFAFVILSVAVVAYTSFIFEKRGAEVDDHHHDHTDEYHSHSHREVAKLPEGLSLPSRDPDADPSRQRL